MSFIVHNAPIGHAHGTHQLEVEIEGDEAVIRFGASFTLRMSETQVDALREEHGVYAVRSGRINVAGLTEANLPKVAAAIRAVL